MEIVLANKLNKKYIKNGIVGVYGDLLDLINDGCDVDGIYYEDEYTVKRFLNGFKLNTKRMNSVLNYLNISNSILNIKLKDLSKLDLKYVLLAYALINKYNTLIFDYFDVGLTSKEQKELLKTIKKLSDNDVRVIIITNNLVFLSKIIDYIFIYKEKLVYEGKLKDLFKNDIDLDEISIVRFISLANKKKAKLEYTLDSKELMKDIYRSVV